jgi:hypothetical protein
LEKECTFISAVGDDTQKSDIIMNSLKKVNLVKKAFILIIYFRVPKVF